MCYVAENYDEELSKSHTSPQDFNQEYHLADGRKITLGKERFQCTEAIFNPNLTGV